MPRNSVASGPSVGLPAVFVPPVSNNAVGYTEREAYRAVVAAATRTVPTAPTVGHPIVWAWSPTLHEVVATQP
ncbi:hypothetical protein [Mycobacterium sp.]|uniref:hypothetical protein n=1 Tax=Mycobacterium sp. TaxID=1785 RepID=UPI002C074C9A|nr:hypothetical protein [Mycobacterium sp.]HTY35426.1 hypothetical protein [Mycobacterium sp.]